MEIRCATKIKELKNQILTISNALKELATEVRMNRDFIEEGAKVSRETVEVIETLHTPSLKDTSVSPLGVYEEKLKDMGLTTDNMEKDLKKFEEKNKTSKESKFELSKKQIDQLSSKGWKINIKE